MSSDTETPNEVKVNSDEQTVETPSIHIHSNMSREQLDEQMKTLGAVVQGIFGGVMKEMIPQLDKTRQQLDEIVESVLDAVDKEHPTEKEESTTSEDINKLVKEIEDEIDNEHTSEHSESVEECDCPEGCECEDEDGNCTCDGECHCYDCECEEGCDCTDEDGNCECENCERDDEYEYEDDEDEDYEDVEEDEYEDKCVFVVMKDYEQLGYFKKFSHAQDYMKKMYKKFVVLNSDRFMRTERSYDFITVYEKKPYLVFLSHENQILDIRVETVYKFRR